MREYIAKQTFGSIHLARLRGYERGDSGLKSKINQESIYRLPLGVISEYVVLSPGVDTVGRLISAVFSPTERWMVVRCRPPEASGRVL